MNKKQENARNVSHINSRDGANIPSNLFNSSNLEEEYRADLHEIIGKIYDKNEIDDTDFMSIADTKRFYELRYIRSENLLLDATGNLTELYDRQSYIDWISKLFEIESEALNHLTDAIDARDALYTEDKIYIDRKKQDIEYKYKYQIFELKIDNYVKEFLDRCNKITLLLDAGFSREDAFNNIINLRSIISRKIKDETNNIVFNNIGEISENHFYEKEKSATKKLDIIYKGIIEHIGIFIERKLHISDDDFLKKVGDFARDNGGEGVEAYARALLQSMTKQSDMDNPLKDVPASAPEMWPGARATRETPPEFIMRVYGDWMGADRTGKAITLADLRRIDAPLTQALFYHKRKSRPLPEGFDLPNEQPGVKSSDSPHSAALKDYWRQKQARYREGIRERDASDRER